MAQGFASVSVSQSSKPSVSPKSTPIPQITEIPEGLIHHFQPIQDPRVERTKKHLLTDILVIAILAVIAGAKGWEDIENYGISKRKWLQEFLSLPHGIPSDDTFRRVFEKIDSRVLEQCFHQWIESLVNQMAGEVVPIDGKTLRGSYDRNKGLRALHLVSAWASEQRLVLGQVKVEDKSNEITAIPALIELLDLSGAIVTIDAMGTQTEIASQLIQKNADYILALKGNHPTLFRQVKQWFETAKSNNFEGVDFSYDKQVESGHHRTEIRYCWSVPVSAIDNLYQQERWTGLKSVVMVIRIRRLWNKTTREVQFYLTSRDSDARSLGNAIRKHWGIENELHWTLDVSFREDDCRIRSFHSPRNFSILRRMALNALNREKSYKRSLIQKSNRTAMDDDYMKLVLRGSFTDNSKDFSQSFCQG